MNQRGNVEMVSNWVFGIVVQDSSPVKVIGDFWGRGPNIHFGGRREFHSCRNCARRSLISVLLVSWKHSIICSHESRGKTEPTPISLSGIIVNHRSTGARSSSATENELWRRSGRCIRGFGSFLFTVFASRDVKR